MTEIRKHRRILYTRYNALVQRSKKEGLEWNFTNFEHFLDCLEEAVPEDYHPKLYRLKFKNVEKLGYGRQNLVVTRLSSSSKSMQKMTEDAKESANETSSKDKVCHIPTEKHCQTLLIAELSKLMLEGYHDLDDLLDSVLLTDQQKEDDNVH